MKAFLGNWVREKNYGYEGRVHKKYHNFRDTGTDKGWLSIQKNPWTEDDIKSPCYEVLCQDGGSVLLPESALIEVKEYAEEIGFKHPYKDFYFND